MNSSVLVDEIFIDLYLAKVVSIIKKGLLLRADHGIFVQRGLE